MWCCLVVVCIFLCSSTIVTAYTDLIRNFGEVCNHTDDCSDHRYVCIPDANKIHRCTCDRFHQWMGDRYGCIQIVNASDILKIARKGHNYTELIEKEVQFLYRQHAVAGLIVAFIFLLAIIVVVIYGIRMEKMDRTLEKSVVNLQRRNTMPLQRRTLPSADA